MYTVADLTRLFDLKSKTTIRAWAETFAEFLSDGANPDKGQTRVFTERDAQVMHTVHILKQRGMDGGMIAAALGDGEMYPLPAPEVVQDGSGSADEVHEGTSALVTRLTVTLGQFEARAAALEAERDRVLKERDAERGRVDDLIARIERVKDEHAAAILDAEKRATAADARAQLLATQLEEVRNAAAHPPTAPSSPGWWSRLLGRK